MTRNVFFVAPDLGDSRERSETAKLCSNFALGRGDPIDGRRVVNQPTLTFLLDTNAVITLEPFAGASEPDHPVLAEALRIARLNGHHVVTHPANEADLRETHDDVHRNANLRALDKYERIPEPPISDEVASRLGEPVVGTNDHRDLRLLAALDARAATHLVTSDQRFIRKADRVGLRDRVLLPVEALELLRTLHPEDPAAPPQVRLTSASMLRMHEPIFDSLRTDYDFDEWIRTKVAPDHSRRTWIVEGPAGDYRAIAIVKPSDDHPLIPGKKLMKLSTFKVDQRAGGEKLGELLLKTVLAWAHEMHIESLFVTVIKDEEKQPLVHFLRQFGFDEIARLPGTDNEWVFEKHLRPDPNATLSPLDHHVRYGPPAIAAGSEVYVIPIQPGWYRGLFPDGPDSEGGLALPGLSGIEIGPFGNALRKAYLSKAAIKEIPPGAVVLFYRSVDRQRSSKNATGAVYAVGVVEQTVRSSDPSEVLAFVGRRTVYPADEVARMCESGVIAVLFRQDRFLAEPWSLPELIHERVLNGPPQAILRVASDKGRAWVLERLSE